MNMGFKYVAITFLLLAGVGNVFAGPFSRGLGGRSARQHVAAQQDDRQAPPDAHGPATPATAAGAGAREPFVGGNAANRPPEQMRRMGGRMTIEERQALRRQINEAGHDIYATKKQ